MRKTKLSIAAVVAAFGFVGLTAGPALASPAPNWQAYYYVPSQDALHVAPAGTSGAFSFRSATDYVAQETTSSQSLTGDKYKDTVTATITITGLSSDAHFLYNGEGQSWNPCGTPPGVRFYFTSNSQDAGVPEVPYLAGGPGYPGVTYTHYWWSNPVSVQLDKIGNGTATLTATLTPSQWSDWNGQTGTSDPTAFAAAASDIAAIGVSFGGGCFFENGVTTSDGSGQFQISGFTD